MSFLSTAPLCSAAPCSVMRGAALLAHAVWAMLPAIALGAATTVVSSAVLLLGDTGPRRTEVTFRDRHRFDGEGLGRIIVQATARPGVVRYDAAVYPTCVSSVAGDPRTPEEAVPAWASAALLPWSVGQRPWPFSSSPI